MKLKLLTTLLPLIAITLALCLSPLSAWAAKEFIYTNEFGNKTTGVVPDFYTEEQVEQKRRELEEKAKKNKRARQLRNGLVLPETEAEKKHAREICTYRAGKMNNEFAGKKLYESCLADKGLKPEPESKSWFDW